MTRHAEAAHRVNYRELMKRVERVVEEIEGSAEIGATIHTVADAIIEQFRDELGIYGGRLYQRQGDVYVLRATFPEARPLAEEIEVPVSYRPIELVLERGSIYMAPDDPQLDKELEARLGVEGFAAIEVGTEEYVLAFNVAPGHDDAEILFSLGVLRHTINQKVRQERMEEIFEEARRIQTSILPRRIPSYGSFDLAGRSRPMEHVGGDFYDYIPITDKILGLAIADVSGHGLPAALQVRDIYMGLRMGLARDFKIVRTVERLNNIIHKSTLTSRFVSMFYGELELSGVFIYVNAGHPPPFHLAADGAVRFLEEGGAVLGPIPDATYERGFVTLKRGELLVFYTDGMVEAPGPGDEEYGVDRLVEAVRRRRREPAGAVVDALFEEVAVWSGGRPATDDRTVMVVSHPERREGEGC